jgi:hypothetical protein
MMCFCQWQVQPNVTDVGEGIPLRYQRLVFESCLRELEEPEVGWRNKNNNGWDILFKYLSFMSQALMQRNGDCRQLSVLNAARGEIFSYPFTTARIGSKMDDTFNLLVRYTHTYIYIAFPF